MHPHASGVRGRGDKLNERWTLGFSVAGLTGAEVEYDDDWVGRHQAQKVTLVGIAAVPGIAWRATDKLSIGLALPVLYTDLELDVAIPNLADPINGPDGQASIDGDDTNVGVQLGAIYQFNQRTRGFFQYIDLGEAELGSGRFFGGEYDPNRIFLIGANLQYFPSQ